MARLIVIEESFAEALPRWLTQREAKRFTAELHGGEHITVVEYAVADAQKEEAIFRVSEFLLPHRYYAHIVAADCLLVAFRHCVFRLHRGDARTIELCKSTGIRIGIPTEEMQFELMFDNDHPDLPGHD